MSLILYMNKIELHGISIIYDINCVANKVYFIREGEV